MARPTRARRTWRGDCATPSTSIPALTDSEPALGALCGALAENAAIPTCIVLDDVHHVPPDSPGGRLLRDLLALAPENAHFVVASREPVAGLARRRVHREVVEITEPDLRFTSAELATHRGCDRDPSASGAGADRPRRLARTRQPGDDVRTERGAGVRA